MKAAKYIIWSIIIIGLIIAIYYMFFKKPAVKTETAQAPDVEKPGFSGRDFDFSVIPEIEIPQHKN